MLNPSGISLNPSDAGLGDCKADHTQGELCLVLLESPSLEERRSLNLLLAMNRQRFKYTLSGPGHRSLDQVVPIESQELP